MAEPRFLARVAGRIKMVVAIATSAGAADAEKIPSTNASGVLDDTIINAATTGASKTVKTLPSGLLDLSIMPAGVGPDTASFVASEALTAGNLVNIWDDAGTAKVRKADATTEGKEAAGFVLSAFAAAASALVYFEGRNTQLTGLTAGAPLYLSTTPGAVTAVAPSAAGNVVQSVGGAYSATAANFEAGEPTTVA